MMTEKDALPQKGGQYFMKASNFSTEKWKTEKYFEKYF